MAVKMQYLGAAAIVLAVQMPAAVAADQISTPVPFAVFDVDANGYIDEQEFSRVRSARIEQRSAEGRMMRHMGQAPRFAEIDADGDGRINAEEYQAHQQLRRQQGFGGGPGR